MRKARLDEIFVESGDTGTYSQYTSDSGLQLYILERPATGDHPRIKGGKYIVCRKQHPIHGLCYELEDRDGRTAILIHSANWFWQLLGCLAPGRSIQEILQPNGKMMKGVTSSKDALMALEADMGYEPFELTINRAAEGA